MQCVQWAKQGAERGYCGHVQRPGWPHDKVPHHPADGKVQNIIAIKIKAFAAECCMQIVNCIILSKVHNFIQWRIQGFLFRTKREKIWGVRPPELVSPPPSNHPL